MILGQGHFPQAQVPHATRGNHSNTQMGLGAGSQTHWWQEAGPSQHYRHHSSASDRGPQRTPWDSATQAISATQAHRCLATGQMAIRAEGVGGPPGSRRPCSLNSCASSSGISLENCLCGKPRADGSLMLEVVAVQPRWSGSALSLLGVIFPIWK